MSKFAERLEGLIEGGTLGPFEFCVLGTGIPAVIGSGLVGRSVIARHADDPEGHADAELHALLRNHAAAIAEIVWAVEHVLIDDKCVYGSMRALRDALAKLEKEQS